MAGKTLKVTLPNGTTLDFNGDMTTEDVRQHLQALGIANVNGAVATERINAAGGREVRFAEPAGTQKGN